MLRVIIILAAVCALAYGECNGTISRTPIGRFIGIKNANIEDPSYQLAGSHIGKPSGRIVGGSDANIVDFPYQLSLAWQGNHICGASIISANWALTTANCLQNLKPSGVTLRAGSSTRNSGGTVHQGLRTIQHPEYCYRNIDYDYGLVQVVEPFPLGRPGVRAIQLADEEPTSGDAIAIVSGYGQLSSTETFPNQLQSVQVPIIPRPVCEKQLVLSTRIICAGSPEEGRDFCSGDKGGPLVIGDRQVGVASWYYDCGGLGLPGLYASVADQRGWIRQNTGV